MPKKEPVKQLSADEQLDKLIAEGLEIGLDIPVQEWYSTGNMALDAVSGGGIPVGRIVTFAGAQASGKTTTAVSTARSVLEQGRRVLFWDAERTLDKEYFKSLGVDPDDTKRFVRMTPKTMEKGFDAVRKLTNTGEFGLTIVDSIPAMVTEKELSSDLSDGMNLALPKMLRAALKQANDYCYENDSTMILLNHLMEKVDITFFGQQLAAKGIKQYTMPGGTGPQFYSSMILWFTKSQWPLKAKVFDPILNEEVDKRVIGFEHKVNVAKNKVAKPDGETTVINILGEGFSNARTAFEVLKSYGLVKKSGSWFSARDDRLKEFVPNQVQGEESFYSELFDGPGRGVAVNIARELLQKAYDDLESSPDSEETESEEE